MIQCKTEFSNAEQQDADVERAVASRAFSLFESGGRRHGRHLDHWLNAERQLYSADAPPEVTEGKGTVTVRARVTATPGTDLVASVSKERVLIFRAAPIGDDWHRDLLQVIPLNTQLEIDQSEALLDGPDLVVKCTCPLGRA